MIINSWYEKWKGNHSHLPRSERQGHELARNVLVPLQAQISVFFGNINGDLAALCEGVAKLSKGESIICNCCQQDIWKSGHHPECQILKQSIQVTTEPPQPIYKPTKSTV